MTQVILLLISFFVVSITAISFYFNYTKLKFVVILLLTLLSSAVYFSLDGVKGWPSEDTRVVKGNLASVVIINPSDTDPGAIYISLFPTTPIKWYEYEYPRYAPKTFYVKYTNDRAAEFEKAKQALEQGKQVRINGIPPEKISNGTPVEGTTIMEMISGMMSQYMSDVLPQQGDTYRPEVPDIEITESQVPPEKGTN